VALASVPHSVRNKLDSFALFMALPPAFDSQSLFDQPSSILLAGCIGCLGKVMQQSLLIDDHGIELEGPSIANE
jgi:hypothetical protein